MPRDATGTYTLPLAPFVAGTLAKAGEVNSNLSDIAQALTDSQSRSTPSPALGDLNMNGHDITNLGQVQGDLIASKGVWANGLSSNFGFEYKAPLYVWHWGAAGYDDTFDPATGTRTWATPGGSSMLSSGGVLTVAGSISAPSLSVSGAITAASATFSGTIGVGLDLGVQRNAYITGTLTAGAATVSGALSVTGSTTTGALTAGAFTAASVTSTSGVYAGGSTNFGFLVSSGNYLFSWGTTGAYDFMETATGTRHWRWNGLDIMTLGTDGTLAAQGAFYAAKTINGGTLLAYAPTGRGGFVGSYEGDSGGVVGFWNSNGVVNFGNADTSGVPSSATIRMHLDGNSNLVGHNGIYAVNEVHAGRNGVYYTGVDASELHAIAFLWTGTRLDVFADRVRLGSITLGTREAGVEEAPEMAALEARIAALEARIVALGG